MAGVRTSRDLGPVLLVFAHPDDESFGLAGTIAKYSRRGAIVDLICATRGEKGTRLDVPSEIDTGTAREAELRAAAAITGIRKIHLLGYIDGELNKADLDKVVDKIVKIARLVKPEVMITFGPDGISGHPDHIAVSEAATKAYELLLNAAAPPTKLYYVTVPQSAVTEEESGIATRPDKEVTTTIKVGRYRNLKIRAIAAHRSQADAREFVEWLRQDSDSTWGSREYLYLASPRSTAKETDLFHKPVK